VEKFYDLLFEISNDYRHEILLILIDNPLRVTDISKKLDLTSQEISRHVARLGEAGLTIKDVDGYHHVSHYGMLVLSLLEELEFASLNRDYFMEHTLLDIPQEFVKRIGYLKDSNYTDNVINFIQGIEKLIQESNQYVFFIADQFPISSLGFINEALDRGVKFRSITSKEVKLYDEETEGKNRAIGTPLFEYRSLDPINLILFVSEKDCVLSFKTSSGSFDYKGFLSSKRPAVLWSKGLFDYLWEVAEPFSMFLDSPLKKPARVIKTVSGEGSITVEGRDDHRIDPYAVQDAVDNYDEVILRGVFNFEDSTVTIRKSVHIRGEGREDDIPSTIVYRKHWSFPSAIVNQLFLIEGEDAEVTIENLHFNDFFAYCIFGVKGKKVDIINNRITLESGFYRGITGFFGDSFIGFVIIEDFPGGVNIENNYINFATSHLHGGYVLLDSMKGLDGRPDCINHKYFSSYCVYVRDVSGDIRIVSNIFKNMTARAISVSAKTESTNVEVSKNQISSDVYGSYVIDNRWAGIGITAHCSWHYPTQGFNLKVESNSIKYSKPGYCGVALLGPYLSPSGIGKLSDGIVMDNQIELKDGTIGILVESCDRFDILRNKISGSMYYGIGLFPRFDSERAIMGAFENTIKNNDLKDLDILKPDLSNKNMFSDSSYKNTRASVETAHIWLNPNTANNRVELDSEILIFDEGKGNIISINK
jgi:predicted transcriptional regulator